LALIGLEKEALAAWDPPTGDTFGILGRTDAAAEVFEANFANDTSSSQVTYGLAITLAAAGDYDRARPLLEELLSAQAGKQVQNFGFEFAAALIAIRRSDGDVEDLDQLVAPVKEDANRLYDAGITSGVWLVSADFSTGLMEYLAGNKAEGLALISKAASRGYFIYPNEEYLRELYEDPGFAPIREEQEQRQKRERDRFLSIVCGSNPFANVWQPEESTCERFLADKSI
jgi:tetratricopeptide (TPR) repeat protein